MMNLEKTNKKNIPDNALILGKDQYYSTDGIETQLNNNVLVVGASGSGKTRGIVKPNILQMNGSMIISDPKGNLYRQYGDVLEENGYEVVHMDFIHPERSAKYNPLTRLHSTSDVTMMADMMVYSLNTKAGTYSGSHADPFWPKSEKMLYSALLGYLYENDDIPESQKTMEELEHLLQQMKADGERSDSIFNGLTALMKEHQLKMLKRNGARSWAYERFMDVCTAPAKTFHTILITALATLVEFDNLELRQMMSGNDVDFKRVGQEKTAIFVEVSDTDRSNDTLINLFYSQLMSELCKYADEECENSRLPIPVTFILDDFATNAKIANFERSIANIRSRNISAILMVQTEAQLAAGYGDDAQTIVDNCDTYVYLGGNNPDQAEKVAKRVNKTANTVLNMPLCKGWICRRGQEPVMCDRFDIDGFEVALGIREHVEESEHENDSI